MLLVSTIEVKHLWEHLVAKFLFRTNIPGKKLCKLTLSMGGVCPQTLPELSSFRQGFFIVVFG
jgi:hypothetical protein